MKMFFLEANEDLLRELIDREAAISSPQPVLPESPPPRPRSDFASNEEWELYQLQKEVADGMAQIRKAARDPVELHEMKTFFLEKNEDLLRELVDKETAISAPEPAPLESAAPRPRSDFASEEAWELYQQEREIEDGLLQIRRTARDMAELHEMKMFFLEANEDLMNELEMKRTTLNVENHDPEPQTK